MEFFAQVSWPAVAVAFVVSYGLGAVWFNIKVFGQTWMDAQPHRKAEDYGNPLTPMLVQAVATLLMAIFVVWLMAVGGVTAVLINILVVATSMIGGALFLGQKPGVWLVSTSYTVVMIVIAAVCGTLL